MGGIGIASISVFGVTVTFKSANPEDRERISAFVEAAGFEKAKEAVEATPSLKKAMTDNGCEFPEYEAEMELWFEEMTPEQGKAIC